MLAIGFRWAFASNLDAADQITRLYAETRYNAEDVPSVHRTLLFPALPESWKQYFPSATAADSHLLRRCNRKLP